MTFEGPINGFIDFNEPTAGADEQAEKQERDPPPRPWSENITPICWPDMAGRYAPARRFVVDGWIPYGCVTSLYGTGGIGKSLLAQLLAAAVAAGRNWLGIRTEQCRVLALFCEDDREELWRRQERINDALGIAMADLRDFLPDARTGRENVLAHGRDVLQTTALYEQIAAAIAWKASSRSTARARWCRRSRCLRARRVARSCCGWCRIGSPCLRMPQGAKQPRRRCPTIWRGSSDASFALGRIWHGKMR